MAKVEQRELPGFHNQEPKRGLMFDAGKITVGQYLNNWLTGNKGTVRQ
jgi:hypothetical protein